VVRLARIDGGHEGPWCQEGREALHWPLSQVTVARRLVGAIDPAEAAVVARLASTQPFQADDVVTVPLRRGEGDAWVGRARALRVRGGETVEAPVIVTYTVERGLDVRDGV
jgi:hypothetical protein